MEGTVGMACERSSLLRLRVESSSRRISSNSNSLSSSIDKQASKQAGRDNNKSNNNNNNNNNNNTNNNNKNNDSSSKSSNRRINNSNNCRGSLYLFLLNTQEISFLPSTKGIVATTVYGNVYQRLATRSWEKEIWDVIKREVFPLRNNPLQILRYSIRYRFTGIGKMKLENYWSCDKR
ncbi:hypothetical protein HZH68_010708 [Vespula germanica]|uniref:Uncharacterized protein n=1 Tax=Vespula germanica TaxID=30212 RepID=A0A834N3R4_VESGE|nr:hypothetical protein HZH68_010708 [Vespula germanica]